MDTGFNWFDVYGSPRTLEPDQCQTPIIFSWRLADQITLQYQSSEMSYHSLLVVNAVMEVTQGSRCAMTAWRPNAKRNDEKEFGGFTVSVASSEIVLTQTSTWDLLSYLIYLAVEAIVCLNIKSVT